MNAPEPVLDSNADGLIRAELLRVRAYLLLWATPAGLLLLLYFLGFITKRTEIPSFFVQELAKPLESHGLLVALGLTVVAFGLSWVVGAAESARVIAEDMGSVLYFAGAFCIDMVPAVSIIRFSLSWAALKSVGIGVLAIVLGMLLQTFGEVAVRERESKHVWQGVKRWVRARLKR